MILSATRYNIYIETSYSIIGLIKTLNYNDRCCEIIFTIERFRRNKREAMLLQASNAILRKVVHQRKKLVNISQEKLKMHGKL